MRTIVRAHSNRAHYTIHHKAIQLYCDFCREALVEDSGGPDGQGLELRGAYLYRLPLGSPGLEVLRVIHPGWWLGTLKKGRFEPSPALAMRLPADSARQTLRLKTRDARLLAYLRGEPLLEAGQEGWVLVSVEGFPLGWDRRVGGLIKNYYPRGLRWR